MIQTLKNIYHATSLWGNAVIEQNPSRVWIFIVWATPT